MKEAVQNQMVVSVEMESREVLYTLILSVIVFHGNISLFVSTILEFLL